MNVKNTGIATLLMLIVIVIMNRYLQISLWWLVLPLMAYTLLLVLGAILIQWNFYIQSIHSISEFYRNTGQEKTGIPKQICLSFDDGIHTVNTPRALNILKEKNIKAVFFIIGKNIAGNEAILKRMHEEGHIIGNHSYFHSFSFDMQSTRSMMKEILDTNLRIEETIGARPMLFRPPYGVTNPNLAKAIKRSGMKSIGWNIRSLDTVAKSGNDLLNKLKQKTKPDAIVLLHERCDITIGILTDYIDYCVTEGYTFATLKPAYVS